MQGVELSVLAPAGESTITILARRGHDTAVDALPAKLLVPLADFRARIDRAIRGAAQRPTKQEMRTFGRTLFELLACPGVRPILSGLPKSPISMAILSNRPDVQALPWEFLAEPNLASPSVLRSVVRIVPTVGVPAFTPRNLAAKVRILFVSADPTDQGPVDWPAVKALIDTQFKTEYPRRLRVRCDRGSNAAGAGR